MLLLFFSSLPHNDSSSRADEQTADQQSAKPSTIIAAVKNGISNSPI
jgi:hypothetical protein